MLSSRSHYSRPFAAAIGLALAAGMAGLAGAGRDLASSLASPGSRGPQRHRSSSTGSDLKSAGVRGGNRRTQRAALKKRNQARHRKASR